MTQLCLARALAVTTVVFGALFYLLGDLVKPGFSSSAQYISELNATGTTHAAALGFLGFLPVGLLFAGFLVIATPLALAQGIHRGGWWLLWSQPVAFIGTAFVPCDAGCPVGGSATQMLHDLLSLFTYFAGAAGIFLLSFPPVRRGKPWAYALLRISGIAFLVLFAIMLSPELHGIRGLLQRLGDALLAAVLLTIAWPLLAPPAAAAGRHAERHHGHEGRSEAEEVEAFNARGTSRPRYTPD